MPREALNIVNDDPVTLAGLADRLLEVVGGGVRRTVPPWLVSMFAGQAVAEMATMSARCRNDRAMERIGWRPRFPSTRECLQAVVRSFERRQ